MKKLLALGLLLVSTSVFADAVLEVTITPPSTYQDGTVISPTEISNYEFDCSATSGDYSVLVVDETIPNGTNPYTTTTVLTPGTYYCVARTVTVVGEISVNSSEYSVIVPTSLIPNPPILSIIVNEI